MTELTAADLALEIEAAWEARDGIGPDTKGPARTAVEEALSLLDNGRARVAEKTQDGWFTHQWLKKAVLLSFRLNPNTVMRAGAMGGGGMS